MKATVVDIGKYLNQLEGTPRRIAAAVKVRENVNFRAKRDEKSWSVNDILAHLRSCADVWGASIEAMLAEERPDLEYVHPRKWIRQTDYPGLPFDKSFRAFAMQRKNLLKVLKKLSFEDWSRSAIIEGREHTVFSQVRRLAKHELEHCRQIEETLK